MRTLTIHPSDNVEVDLDTGHKKAKRDIKKGETVIKYGCPIGHATRDIKKDETVHTDNLKTNLDTTLSYTYEPVACELVSRGELYFDGYQRYDGSVGVRNELWVIPTVGCVNETAKKIAEAAGGYVYTHPYGCSQLGDDHLNTQEILRGLVKHPNAGGVLVVGLGCENNTMDSFVSMLGDYDSRRVKFLVCQDCGDEIAAGLELTDELKAVMADDVRVPCPTSKLRVGLKCGGSDGYSGITANPLVGRFSDRLISHGGCAVMTEVPEMFGAETLLMARAESREVFDDIVSLINNIKRYFESHGQVIYENPSPGNKAGGITTLEEKSLGCTQKSGSSPVRGVIKLGISGDAAADSISGGGLYLLDGPGNDMVAVTNLTAAGCQIILFTTGRGTPLGAPVPTVKISTNARLAAKKPHWIDFDASPILDGIGFDELTDRLLDYVLSVANGAQTRNEVNGYRDIAIFKDGVTL